MFALGCTIAGTYNNQRSEKDPSAWAMVHEVGHGHHFTETEADIAFVTKNALALRDAHSKESLTAPFKSIQKPSHDSKPPAADESMNARPTSKHQNEIINAPPTAPRPQQPGHNNSISNPNSNIFSFNSSSRNNVKAVVTEAAEPYDDDSNFEKESTASFDFNRHRHGHASSNVVNPLSKPTPSKWDDAEKWLSAGESAPATAAAAAKSTVTTSLRPKNSPQVAVTQSALRKGEAYPNPDVDPAVEGANNRSNGGGGENVDVLSFDVEDTSPEKMNKFLVDCTKKVEASSKKSLLPRFAFMPSGKPVPLPLPAAPVDRYPLEDMFGRDESNARETSMHGDVAAHEPFSVRTAKPTAGVTIGTCAQLRRSFPVA